MKNIDSLNCKECISYAICRSNLIEYIEDCIDRMFKMHSISFHHIDEKSLIYGGILSILVKKCSYMYCYLYHTKLKHGLNVYGGSKDEFVDNVCRELDICKTQHTESIQILRKKWDEQWKTIT